MSEWFSVSENEATPRPPAGWIPLAEAAARAGIARPSALNLSKRIPRVRVPRGGKRWGWFVDAAAFEGMLKPVPSACSPRWQQWWDNALPPAKVQARGWTSLTWPQAPTPKNEAFLESATADLDRSGIPWSFVRARGLRLVIWRAPQKWPMPPAVRRALDLFAGNHRRPASPTPRH